MSEPLHIAVLMGGWSAEREVSLSSGAGIADALESLGHRVTRIDMDRNIATVLVGIRPDVVFNALHGTPGEDGRVQGMLDLMQIPFVHISRQKHIYRLALTHERGAIGGVLHNPALIQFERRLVHSLLLLG